MTNTAIIRLDKVDNNLTQKIVKGTRRIPFIVNYIIFEIPIYYFKGTRERMKS